jgi:choice-of-anchor B domain-containing protein
MTRTSAIPGAFLVLDLLACGGPAETTTPPPPKELYASISIDAHPDTLRVLGTTTALTATVKDTSGATLVNPGIAWTSSNPAVLAISATGLVTAAKWGSADVIAKIGTRSDTARVTVFLTGPVGQQITGHTVSCQGGVAGPFPCSGIDLLSFLPVSALGGGQGVDLNDLWGWTDASTGKEYALVGRRDGVAFVDVSTPTDPAYLGYLPIPSGAIANVWHDVKVYQDHAYIVSDGAGPHGMQVFELKRLRDYQGVPITFSPLTVYHNVASVHNIVINEASGFAYLVGSNSGGTTCGGGLHMVDIHDPMNPTFAGCFADVATGRARTGYTHDAECVEYHGPDAQYAGHEICFGANETALSIADVSNKAAPVALSHASYPGVSYTHQGWLSDDQRYLYLNDELDEEFGTTTNTRTLIWDVAELDDPVLAGQYFGPTSAIDHNNYVKGDRLYASNYQFGVRVISIANPTSPTQLGFFDTAPDYPNVPGFGGSWSNYPFFASGILVVTSREEGLFVLKVR